MIESIRRSRSGLSRLLSIALFMTTCSLSSLAQSGGSSYSSLNLGDLETITNGVAAGRAGVETAVPSVVQLNGLNPAAWSSLTFVSIQTALSFEQYNVSTADASLWQNRVSLKSFSVGLPASRTKGFTIGLGVRPLTTVNYATASDVLVPNVDTVVSGTRTSNGSGGVSEGFIGASYRPFSWLSVGASLGIQFGASTELTRFEINSSNYNEAAIDNTTRYSGISGSFGVIVQPIEKLSIGAAITPPSTLNAETISLGLFREGVSDDTLNIDTTEISHAIPLRMSVGASYQIGRTLLSGDLLLQSWAGSSTLDNARNRMRTAIGIDYLPNTSAGSRGTDRWTLRAGLWREQTYVTIDDVGIDAMGVSFGGSIPFSPTAHLGSGAGIDLGIELGTRGSTENGHSKELFGKLTLGLLINEMWF